VLIHSVGVFVAAGKAEPLGPSKQGNAINFAVYSQAATAMSLVLHNPTDGTRQEIQMNKSGEAQVTIVVLDCWELHQPCVYSRQEMPMESVIQGCKLSSSCAVHGVAPGLRAQLLVSEPTQANHRLEQATALWGLLQAYCR
jgi:pullulanase/glycogen debranching enzyme